MDVSFATLPLQRLCNERTAMTARWGKRAAGAVARSLQELEALEHLGEVAGLPHVRLTEEPSRRIVLHTAGGIRLSLEAGDELASHRRSLHDVRSVVVVGISMTAGKQG